MSSVQSVDLYCLTPPPREYIVVRDFRRAEYVFGARNDPDTGERQYLVKFRELDASHAMWLPAAGVGDPGLIEEFEARLRAAQPRRKLPRRCVHIGLESYKHFIGAPRRAARARRRTRVIDLTR